MKLADTNDRKLDLWGLFFMDDKTNSTPKSTCLIENVKDALVSMDRTLSGWIGEKSYEERKAEEKERQNKWSEIRAKHQQSMAKTNKIVDDYSSSISRAKAAAALDDSESNSKPVISFSPTKKNGLK